MLNKKLYNLITLFFLLTVLVGCSQQAAQAICPGLITLGTTVSGFANLPAEATVKEIKDVLATVGPAIQAIKTANQALALQPVTDLTTAYDELATSINTQPDDAPIIGETAVQIQDAVDKIQAALTQANSTLNCAQ